MTFMSLQELEKTMKGFSNRRRLKVLNLLSKNKRLNVSEIAEKINLSFKSTSQHLQVLDNAGLVEKQQEALMVFYSLSDKHREPIKVVLNKLK